MNAKLAVHRAYTQFALRHPRWAASLFDEHFLERYAGSLLDRRIDQGMPIDAAELANVYINQFPWPGPLLAQSLAHLVDVAADFLACLDAELGSPPEPPNDAQWLLASSPAELGHVLTVYAEALRTNSNYALDWLWLAAHLPAGVDRRYCLERAQQIDPESPIVRRACAELQAMPNVGVARRLSASL